MSIKRTVKARKMFCPEINRHSMILYDEMGTAHPMQPVYVIPATPESYDAMAETDAKLLARSYGVTWAACSLIEKASHRSVARRLLEKKSITRHTPKTEMGRRKMSTRYQLNARNTSSK